MADENENLSLEAESGGEMLTLKSMNGEDFELERKYAYISKLVKTSVETDSSANEVPIPSAKSDILKLVVDYMKHHQGTEPAIIEKPLRSSVMKDVCNQWDADFIDSIGENRQQLYDLILAANYMDIKSLLHLGCAKVASLIKGKPLEKIKDILAVAQSKTDEKKTE